MRISVAGATGVIERRLIPILVQAGHSVVGMTRSPGKKSALRAASAETVVADALDAGAVMAAVRKPAPGVVVHQLTALPIMLDIRKIEQQFDLTNRLHTEGIHHLLEAGLAVSAHLFVAQSSAGWRYARAAGPAKSEQDVLDTNPPPRCVGTGLDDRQVCEYLEVMGDRRYKNISVKGGFVPWRDF